MNKSAKACRILVGIDGSECSTRALRFALDRASANRAPVFIVNVQPTIPPSRHVSRAMIDEHHRRQSKEALRATERLLKKCKTPSEVSIKVGDPAATILTTAKAKRCTEIILGNSGHGWLSGLLLGSVATKVIQLAPCPVTVVK